MYTGGRNKMSDGLIIKSVTIYKFGSYQGEKAVTFTLNEGLIEIVGKNGAGKSTIIDAITFAIYRATTRTDKGISIFDICKINGYTTVVFEKNGKTYEVTRKRRSETAFDLRVKEGEEFIKGGINDITKHLIKVIGLNYDAFVNVVIVRQEEAKQLGDAKDSKRAEIMENIYRLNIYGKAEEKANEMKKKIVNDMQVLGERIRIQENIVKDLPSIVESIKMNEVAHKRFTDELKNIVALIDAKNTSKKGLEKSEEDYQVMKGSITTMEQTIVSLQTELTGLAKPDASEKRNWEKEVVSLDFRKEKKEKLAEFTNYKTTLASIRERIINITEEYTKKIDNAKYDLTPTKYDSRKILEMYKLGKATYDDVKHTFEVEILGSLQENLRKEMDDKIEKENEQIHIIEKKIEEITLKYGINERTTIAHINSEINASEKCANYLREFESQMNFYNENKKSIETKIIENARKLQDFKNSLKRLKENHDAFENIKIEIDNLQSAQNNITEQIGKVKGELIGLVKKHKELKDTEEELSKAKESYKKMERNLAIYTFIKEKVFHTRGVSSYVLSTLLEDLSDEASIIIRELTSHRSESEKSESLHYQNITFITKGDDEKRKYGIDIAIDGRSIAEFSGGERTLIATAIRIAMAQQLSKSLGSSIKMVIIDEGDIGSLDANSRASFAQLLSNLRKVFKTIVLITHIEGLTDEFDQTITVYRDEENNSAIKT